MKILRARLKPGKGTSGEFISVEGRIKGLVKNNPSDNLDFVVNDGKSFIKTFGIDYIDSDLVGKKIQIMNSIYSVQFNADGSMEVVSNLDEDKVMESLPRASTVNQLKKIRKKTRSTDIGDRIKGNNGYESAKINNSIDTGIESYEDFEKKNKKFIPGWNFKNLKSPFRD